MRVAGLISGTSVDGIDVAVVDIGETIQMVRWKTVPYEPEVRAAILSVSNAATHTATIARLNFLLGELFADALRATGIPLETIASAVARIVLSSTLSRKWFQLFQPIGGVDAGPWATSEIERAIAMAAIKRTRLIRIMKASCLL